MWRRGRADDDFSSEIRAHIELETDRLIGEGVAPAEARLAARKAFGSVAAAEERFYESARILWLDHLRQDVRGAARSVVKYPVAALVAILSLAFGIGAMTATLTIRDVVFRKPPPAYGHAAQLSRVQMGRPDRPIAPIGSYVPGALFETWRAALGPAIAAVTPPRGVRDVRLADRTVSIAVRSVTPDLFAVLEVAPALGRLSLGDDRGQASVRSAGDLSPATETTPVVLSYRVWQSAFDHRADVLGSVVWIENEPHIVIGVLPERFWISDMHVALWVPIDPQALAREEALEVLVRRPPGVTHDALASQLGAGLAGYIATRPASERQARIRVSGVEGTPMGAQMSILLPYVLGASVVLTLLIACANVAVLMIAQWTAREHEIAIRASLGASRGRIVRALLTESMLLASVGGALGVCATFALRGIIVSRAGGNLSYFDLSIDRYVLVQSAAITVLVGILAGIVPALYETRRLHTNPLTTLASSDRIRQRWRHALVVMEITVTVALLVETGSMIAGYRRAIAAEMGFERRPLLSALVENRGGIPVARMLDAVAHLPGVAAAAAGTSVPFRGSGSPQRVAAEATAANAIPADQAAISPGFFATLGVPLREGRDFSTGDSAASRVAIVNEALARQLFPGGNAIGSRVFAADTAYDIVGVAGDYATNPFQQRHIAAKLFVPLAMDSTVAKQMPIVVRAAGDPAPLLQTVRREVRDTSAGNAVLSIFTYDQITQVMGEEMLVGTAPLVPLIAIGMLLTTAGIYGVLAFAIARRARELAVRVAIGATGRDLVRLVTAHSLRLVLLGTAFGIGATFALSRIVRASGGAGSVYDPTWPAFVVPVLIVAVIGALATWIPSRRAMKINPAVILRNS